ncbi:uncharacterized protein F4807DRAFT_413375 [Annulohypoxylon truncatum]|uniref:uncharacterized protein n=1 Tax=Annulohypoxylon truncatum TaxID=327061 RepID=UPI002008ABD0|nr:uncharacterized protein F4807DRAFT_413375 [Annulohypoxylon truncatum]KAI1212530.1 hypothetical protein F4807DRAFT_413375 [Annulohypoxylon truncatum]
MPLDNFFYKPPPPPTSDIIVRRVGTTVPVPESASQLAAEAEAEAETEAGAEAEAVAEAKAELNVDVEAETVRPIPRVKLYNKIHIIGFDANARFAAQALSSVPKLPPVQLLTHNIRSMKMWREEGQAITMYNYKGVPLSTQAVPCPEYVGRQFAQRWTRPPILHNIIVSTLTGAVIPSLAALTHSIDRRTTICLATPGLGMMEELNETIFKDPASRPNYILCHSDHRFERVSSYQYSLKHIPGKFLLHSVPRDDEDVDLDRRTSEGLGRQHRDHMIKLLSKSGDLAVVPLVWEVFLRQKLPGMIFMSLADTISVILGCRFDQIRTTKHIMEFWDRLLEETIHIVASLPELREHLDILDFFTSESFPKKLRRKLELQRSEYSQWISLIRKAKMPPIDVTNGYFVRRARELGIRHTLNSQVISLVKGRQAGRYRELQMDIPLGLQPFVQDLDKIGGGQPRDDPILDKEIDF